MFQHTMTKQNINALLEKNREILGDAYEYFKLKNIKITNDRIPSLYVWISNHIKNQPMSCDKNLLLF